MSGSFPMQIGAGRWLSQDIYEESGEHYYTRREAMNHHHWLRDNQLHRWEAPGCCRYLPGGRSINIRRPAPPEPIRGRPKEITVYSAADLQRITVSMSTPPEEVICKDGLTWATRLHFRHKFPRASKKWFYTWSHKESRTRKGEPALRSIAGTSHRPGKGGPTKVLYYCIEDAQAIFGGQEEEPSGYARAAEFLGDLLANRPMTLRDVLKAAHAAGFSRKELYHGRIKAGVLYTHVHHFQRGAKSWWYLPGQQVPTNTQPASGEAAQPSGDVMPQPKATRGRPKGRAPERVQREQDMLAAWDRGEFTTKAEAGRAFGFHRQDATDLINDHISGC